MFEKKYIQKGGKESTNVQAQQVTINQGVSISDARDIALDVFKSNFIQLSQVAAETAKQRAGELIEAFLTEIFNVNPESVKNMHDPGVQMAIYTAQKEYARSGEPELEKLLVALLIERIQTDSRSMDQIILDECISISPTLTRQHLNIITLVYLLKNVYNNSIKDIDDLSKFFEIYIVPFIGRLNNSFEGEGFKNQDSRYLIYTGCCSDFLINLNLHELIIRNYRKVFLKTLNEDDGYYIQSILERAIIKSEFERSNGLNYFYLDSDAFTIDKLIINDIIEPVPDKSGLFRFKFLNIYELEKLSYLSNGSLNVSKEIDEFFGEDHMIDPNINASFFNYNMIYVELLSDWNKAQLGKLELTPVGVKLAQMNLDLLLKEKFDSRLFKFCNRYLDDKDIFPQKN